MTESGLLCQHGRYAWILYHTWVEGEFSPPFGPQLSVVCCLLSACPNHVTVMENKVLQLHPIIITWSSRIESICMHVSNQRTEDIPCGSSLTLFCCPGFVCCLLFTTGQVIAIDEEDKSKHSTATVTITILDVNDNSPTFLEDTYKFNVSEHTNVNTTVATITVCPVRSLWGRLQPVHLGWIQVLSKLLWPLTIIIVIMEIWEIYTHTKIEQAGWAA